MKINKTPISNSLKLPELKVRQKFLITEPDDKGFAQDQADKIIRGIYLRNQLKLKPWEKDSFKSIYESSGKSNHQILKNLRIRLNSCKTLNKDDLCNNRYYKENEQKSINDSQEIVQQIHLNSELRNKINMPSHNIKSYTIETKETCKINMLSEFIKDERDKIQNKAIDYERALKNEMNNLDKDIFKFETYTTNELLKRNLKHKYINNIESKRKDLELKIKQLNQEHHVLRDDIPRILKRINDKKIYVNFIHKLFGGEPELANFNLDMNFHIMNDDELHSVANKIQTEMNRTESQENVLQTSTEEDLIRNTDKLDVVFKIIEENIMKTLAINEKIRKEIVIFNENAEKEKEELKKEILEREKEYKKALTEYEIEKENVKIISFSKEDYNHFMRKLHIELFEYVKDTIIKNKKDIDEYSIIDKVIKPTLNAINNKERKLYNLIIEMEKDSNQDPALFNNSVIKIKKENKLLKYYEEKNNREVANNMRNAKILEKINKIIITGKHKYKSPLPLNGIKNKRNDEKEFQNEKTYYKLLYY